MEEIERDLGFKSFIFIKKKKIMDFSSNKKRTNFVRVIVLIASISLLFNFYLSYINWKLIFSNILNILIIAAMALEFIPIIRLQINE
jgi:hypothetical protein